jgi:predicted transcriptional regulator
LPITTKAGLAAELGISKARVSQYVQRGLPVRSDGKLDREQALYWIKRNIYYTLSSHGSTRARHLIRAGFADR